MNRFFLLVYIEKHFICFLTSVLTVLEVKGTSVLKVKQGLKRHTLKKIKSINENLKIVKNTKKRARKGESRKVPINICFYKRVNEAKKKKG